MGSNPQIRKDMIVAIPHLIAKEGLMVTNPSSYSIIILTKAWLFVE
jgi:hypothetical protein